MIGGAADRRWRNNACEFFATAAADAPDAARTNIDFDSDSRAAFPPSRASGKRRLNNE
jgi:hypothetical protein